MWYENEDVVWFHHRLQGLTGHLTEFYSVLLAGCGSWLVNSKSPHDAGLGYFCYSSLSFPLSLISIAPSPVSSVLHAELHVTSCTIPTGATRTPGAPEVGVVSAMGSRGENLGPTQQGSHHLRTHFRSLSLVGAQTI